MTINEAQEKVDQWIKTVGVRYFNELTNTAILMEEVGEVARLMSRIYGEQSFKTAEKAASAKEDLAEEMGDVLFVLICLANQSGVNLEHSLQKIMDKRSIRDADRHHNNEKLK
jgi:NTP pyrophosphatase (non-canonical NTP hydrolase)